MSHAVTYEYNHFHGVFLLADGNGFVLIWLVFLRILEIDAFWYQHYHVDWLHTSNWNTWFANVINNNVRKKSQINFTIEYKGFFVEKVKNFVDTMPINLELSVPYLFCHYSLWSGVSRNTISFTSWQNRWISIYEHKLDLYIKAIVINISQQISRKQKTFSTGKVLLKPNYKIIDNEMITKMGRLVKISWNLQQLHIVEQSMNPT